MGNKIIVLLFFIGVILAPPFSVRAEEASGILWLSINNVDAYFTVSGPKIFTKADAVPFDPGIKIGFGPQFGWKIEHMPTGTYTIIPAKVNGYYVRTYDDESPNKTFTIQAGYSYFNWNTNIEYAPAQIEVRAYGLPSDISVSFTITGPVTYQGETKDGDRGSWKMEKVPQGTYTLVWDEVPGYNKLEPVTITIGYFASNREEFLNMRGISGYFDKKQQTAPALPLSPPSKPVSGSTPTQVPLPEKEVTPSSTSVSEQKSIDRAPLQPPAKSFFSKVRGTVSSFFSRIFSIFSRRSSAPPSLPTPPAIPLQEVQPLQGEQPNR